MNNPYPLPQDTREEPISAGDGGAVYGPFPLRVFDVGDVEVWTRAVDAAEWSLADPAVTKTTGAAFDTFSIAFPYNLPVTTRFKILSRRLHDRTAGVTSGTRTDPTALEKELSKQGTVLQELRRDIGRGVQVQFGAGYIMADDLEDGDTLMVSGGRLVKGANAADITLAQGYAAAAGEALDGVTVLAEQVAADAAAAAAAAANAEGVVDGAFPIDATRIYGTNDDGDERIALTTGEVKDRLKALAFTYPDETAARSDIERSYDSINLKSYQPATGNNFSPGFASIMALLPTRNKIIISVPPGDYDLSSTLDLIQTAAGQSIVLQGAGRGATRFIIQHGEHWCRLGWRSGPVLSKNIEVRDCSFVANVAQTAGYAAFVVEHIYQYRLRNVEIISAATDFILGNPDVADDAQQGLIDGLYASGAMAGTSRVLLHSGSILVFTDTCKFNGNGIGDGLFSQTNPGFNWDGLTVGKITAEQQPRLLTVSGKGLANVDFDGGISDRPSDYHVYIKPAAGGEVNRIAFRGWRFQSRSEDNETYGILLDASNGSKIKDVSINACKMFLAGRSCVQMADPGTGIYRGIGIEGNGFENCGYKGSALLRLAAGQVTAAFNKGWVDGSSGYTYGESWNGASGGRVSSANNWLGYAAGASSGTP